MKLFPVYFDGEVSAQEVARIFEQAGYHVRTVGHQLVASRVPAFLRHDEPADNVLRLPARPRIKRAGR